MMKRNNISKSIQMPLDFGKMKWQNAVKQSGMTPKSKEFINSVLFQLSSINQKAFTKIKNESCLEFVPWISIKTKNS